MVRRRDPVRGGRPFMPAGAKPMTTKPDRSQSQDPDQIFEESIASVREALSGLKYGNVSVTVHEGRVVQIDVTEKKRLKPN
jgi:hypothetical protein